MASHSPVASGRPKPAPGPRDAIVAAARRLDALGLNRGTSGNTICEPGLVPVHTLRGSGDDVARYGIAVFDADPGLTAALGRAVQATLADLPHVLLPGVVETFGLHAPRSHHGLLISGDRFVATTSECRVLQQALPKALAVEMEGAPFAQVCRDYGIPFAAVRTVCHPCRHCAGARTSRMPGAAAVLRQRRGRGDGGARRAGLPPPTACAISASTAPWGPTAPRCWRTAPGRRRMRRMSIFWHCTALGVIRSAVEAGKRISVIADETRPFLQGARLTAWEMVQERIPGGASSTTFSAL